MADQTTSSIVIDAEPGEVMDVIGDFPSYPEWAKGVQEATVVEEGADGWARRVFFRLDVSPIKDEYTLAYEWDGARRGHLDPGRGQDAARARRRLHPARPRGGRTEVTYRLALDVSIPLIGMLKRKGEKILIDTALKGLKKRVESPR